MSAADLSFKQGIAFWARGDGKTYYVMLFLQSRGFTPVVRTFQATTDWMHHRLLFRDFDDSDGSDVVGIFFGRAREVGEFSLQIDDVRLYDADDSQEASDLRGP